MPRFSLPSALIASTLGLAIAASGAPAQAATVHTVSPGADLKVALEKLGPGDTLQLNPGTYDIGFLRGYVRRGTAKAPITVRAANPAQPPLLRGAVKLFDIDYWQISGIRVQATEKGKEALYIGGGKGWTVSNSEFFGARATNAYSNVTIAGNNPENAKSNPAASPSGFRFFSNCVHDAAKSTRAATDHNIYVNFLGGRGTGGRIDHNTVYGHPNGAGIKLGDGGATNALGPWGVRVDANTVADGGRQILLHGNVRNNVIAGNLLGRSTTKFTKSPKTTAIYVNKVTTRTNQIANNYTYESSMISYDTERKLVVKAGNKLGAKPKMNSIGSCAAYKVPGAKHGRWGTGRF